ncbi:MAG: response regulator, partial [Steroidobacteraceae bacterium]
MLSVLVVEDSELDAELTVRELKRAGFEFTHERVQDASAMRHALDTRHWDIILSDESMPGFDATRAIDVLHGTGKDIPLIVVSGTIGEEAAVRLMKAGAQDFILKDRIARLGPAVQRELREAEGRKQQRLDAQARVEAQLRLEQANRRMSVLSARLLEAQEGERALLARDLHDDLGGSLTEANFLIERLRQSPAEKIPGGLASLSTHLRHLGMDLA